MLRLGCGTRAFFFLFQLPLSLDEDEYWPAATMMCVCGLAQGWAPQLSKLRWFLERRSFLLCELLVSFSSLRSISLWFLSSTLYCR